MLENLLTAIDHVGPWAYFIVFALVILESSAFVGLVVPGEVVTVFAGFLAYNGTLRLTPLLSLVATGAILGYLLGFELGRRVPRTWVLAKLGRFGLRAEHLDRAEDFFRRHGGKTVLIARFSPFLRAIVPFVAGTLRLRYPVFVFYWIVGGLAWACELVLLGYLAGASWRVAVRWIGRGGMTLLAIIVVVAIVFWLLRRWRRKRAS
jgi:membrane protein DedA with SNARE-associated domain